MNKIELKKLITETIDETMDERTPPGFPPALKKRIKAQYPGHPEKAYPTMWKIKSKMDEGDKRMQEMWLAWEQKAQKEGTMEEHGEGDMSNPEEKREVEIGREIISLCHTDGYPKEQIEKLANELLSIHGVK